jgi:hypothetical protein
MECFVPCTEIKELEFIFCRYNERRRVTVAPKWERRSVQSAPRMRAAQARVAYLMQAHRQDCFVCQRECRAYGARNHRD